MPSKSAPRRYSDPAAQGALASDLAQACAGCHPAVFEAWRASQHALACRPFDPARDINAPQAPSAPVAVIGVMPIQQLLIPQPGGRFQVFDPALDTRTKEWFSIFGSEKRKGDEWGHFSQRGMNWNAQCAFCHMSDLQKGYDSASDTFETSWIAMGISCTQCHGDMSEHSTDPSRRVERNAALGERAIDNCGSCHSRREELSGKFRPGDAFDEHFRLLLADTPDLYHPNGLAMDEDFELGSLKLSQMGHAGVNCLDCHDPHSGRLRAPADNDSLCLGCHTPPGRRGAAPIDALNHSHHDPKSRGARCIECHMPAQLYMARDLRRDHSFSLPNPELAKDLGLPNACMGCHQQESIDWAIQWSNTWYGASAQKDRPSAHRARLVAQAKKLDRSALPELLTLARSEENEAWRSSLIGLLAPFSDDAQCQAFLLSALDDPSVQVKANAIRALARVAQVRPRLVALRKDPARIVRLYASWATRSTLARDEGAKAELVQWLELNSDQPAGAIRQSELALVEGRTGKAIEWAQKAVRWDPSGPSYHTLARALAAAGKREEAHAALQQARALLGPDVKPP